MPLPIHARLNRTLERMGVKLVRLRPFRDQVALTAVKARELGVGTLIDIGANTGQFATNVRNAGWTGRIVSFEPMSAAHRALSAKAAADPAWIVPPATALGAAAGSAQINIAANSISSSLLPVEERSVDVSTRTGFVASETVQVSTLDAQLRAEWTGPLALKIDTQGYELEVLRGATETLAKVVLVTVEMSLAKLYTGGATVGALFQFLEQAGFRAIAITEGFSDPARNEMLQIDGIFVRVTG